MIGIAFLARQWLESIRQDIVDGRGTHHQALVKSFHARLRPSLCAL